MLRNYLVVALRNLRKHKGYTLLNVAGLATGLAACLFLLLYVQDELSYDAFHEKGDRIYQIGLDGVIGGEHLATAYSSVLMGETLWREFPEVEAFTRVDPTSRALVTYGDVRFYEDDFIWADSTFFEVFSFPLLQGDPATALSAPNSIVLSESAARRYFGDADPMGRVLRYDNRVDYTVTGVARDVPSNAHFRFDLAASFVTTLDQRSSNWVSHGLYTYIVLHEGATPEQVEAKFPDLVRKYVASEFEAATGQSYDEAVAGGLRWGYYLQPLRDLYLRHVGADAIGPTSDARYVYILSAVAVFILLLACINFMNLSTARSAGRAKEVGLRKVLGSQRGQLVRQFLSESVLQALLAFVVALGLFFAFRPLFADLSGKALPLDPGMQAAVFGLLLLLALAAGLLGGAYPAFVLSAFTPVTVLKGTLRSGARASWLRSGLVVFQFTLSIALLAGTGVVFQQLRYMQTEKLGFHGETVVVLPLETREAQRSFESFRATLLQHPGVAEVAASDGMPGRINNTTGFKFEEQAETFIMAKIRVSYDYLETMGMELVAGRDFSRSFTTDSGGAVLINETTAQRFGRAPEEMLGTTLTEIAAGDNDEDLPRMVVGVVKDFHFAGLQETIRPIALVVEPRGYWNVSVRVRPENLEATLDFLTAEWQRWEPGYPPRYTFLDEDFGRFYEGERRLGRLFGVFTGLAIFIACLGLFGLASFMAEQRTKEIGVRKVLGATVPGIVLLLSKDFTRLVLVASALALPLAYFTMDRWLSDFAYRVDLGPGLFIAAGLLSLFIAWLTVSYQSIRAALTDPVRSLRYE